MSRIERILSGVFIALACPLTLFFLGWWGSAWLAIYKVIPNSDFLIMSCAFIALGIGVLIDIVYLKRWIFSFYQLSIVIAMSLYVFWSVIAVAVMMGLPVINLLLGVFAGAYMGRRLHHSRANDEASSKVIKITCLFTSGVIAIISSALGYIALSEPYGLDSLQHLPLVGWLITSQLTLRFFLFLAVLSLVVVQYWSTKALAQATLRLR